jgi:hypothetical protein
MPWPQEKKALGKSGYRGEAAQAHWSLHENIRYPRCWTWIYRVTFVLLSFILALVQSFLSIPPFSLFEIRMPTLCHCVLKIYNFHYDFTWAHK